MAIDYNYDFLSGNVASSDYGGGGTYQVGDVNTSGLDKATRDAALAAQKLKAPTGTAAAGFAGAPGFAGAQIDRTGQQGWADAQKALYNQLSGIASGKTPGAAEIMLKGAQEQNLSNMLAGAAGTAGTNQGASQREALNAMGTSNLQSQQQLAATRMQEQQQALGQMGQLAGQGRGAELELAGKQAEFVQQAGLQASQFLQEAGLQGAEFQQQMAMLNPQLQMQTMQLAQQYMDMAMRGEMSKVDAAMAIERLKAEAFQAAAANRTTMEAANLQAAGQGQGGGLFGFL